MRSPIFSVAFSLSIARTCGFCSTFVLLSDINAVSDALGIEPTHIPRETCSWLSVKTFEEPEDPKSLKIPNR